MGQVEELDARGRIDRLRRGLGAGHWRSNLSRRLTAPARRAVPWYFARPTASSSATPLKRSGIQIGAPASWRPFTPVARTYTARTVPQMLKRPPRNCVEPRNAAENAGSRYAGPIVGSPVPSAELTSTPENAAIAPQQPSAMTTTAEVRTPASRAASVLPPVAYTW